MGWGQLKRPHRHRKSLCKGWEAGRGRQRGVGVGGTVRGNPKLTNLGFLLERWGALPGLGERNEGNGLEFRELPLLAG